MRDYDIVITEENGALTLLPATNDGLIEVIDTGPAGPPGPPGLVKVNHGSNPNVARPSAPLVYWVGTVEPIHGLPDDLMMLKDT